MHFVFYNTNDVFVAEEKLQQQNIPVEVVPTPVQDKAYCGVCAQIPAKDEAIAIEALRGMDYQIVK